MFTAGPRILTAAMIGCVWLSPAHSAILQISATTFVPRTGNDTPDSSQGAAFAGILSGARGFYYAPVDLPAGSRVCRFSLVYRDFDADSNIQANLLRKGFPAGGSAFDPPTTMATAQSTGASDAIRTAVDTTIAAAAINPQRAFYYVELIMPATTLEAIGVQVDYRPQCR